MWREKQDVAIQNLQSINKIGQCAKTTYQLLKPGIFIALREMCALLKFHPCNKSQKVGMANKMLLKLDKTKDKMKVNYIK